MRGNGDVVAANIESAIAIRNKTAHEFMWENRGLACGLANYCE